MMPPKSVVLMNDAATSGTVAAVKNVVKNGPSGAPLVRVTSIPPNVPKSSAKTLRRLVSDISAMKRGTTRLLTGSTPSTTSASSSSRTLRAPEVGAHRGADDAGHHDRADQRRELAHDDQREQPAEAVQRAEQVEEARGLDAGRPVGEGHRRDDQREPRHPQAEQELVGQLRAVGVGRPQDGADRRAGEKADRADLAGARAGPRRHGAHRWRSGSMRSVLIAVASIS